MAEDLTNVKFERELSDPFISPEGEKRTLSWEELKSTSPDIANIFASRDAVMMVEVVTDEPYCVRVKRIYE